MLWEKAYREPGQGGMTGSHKRGERTLQYENVASRAQEGWKRRAKKVWGRLGLKILA